MVNVSFRCEQCGTRLEWDDNIVDTTLVSCKNCDAIAGTYGDLRDAAASAVARALFEDSGNSQ